MSVGRITKSAVERIVTPPAGRREYLWDDRLKGFGAMVTPAGTRCYIVQYKIGGRAGKTRRFSIGQHGNPWTTDRARDRAAELLELVRRSVDPMAVERASAAAAVERQKVDEEMGFSVFADVFLQKHVDDRKMRSAKDIHGVFRRDLKPWFRDKPIDKIDRDDIHELLDQIGERSESAAAKAHKWLRKFFNYAVDKKSRFLKVSPMHAMTSPFADGKRTRVLTESEIGVLWEASNKLANAFRDLVRLLLLTGQRLREVAQMSWAEVDMAKGQWIIPAERTKNKHAHLVPLASQAAAILDAIEPDLKKRKGYILSTDGKNAIAGFSKAKSSLDSEMALVAKNRSRDGIQAVETGHWVYHDLRRTFATGCQAKGVPLNHTEAVLNHRSGTRGGIAGVYHLHEYEHEKKLALDMWSNHVKDIISTTSAILDTPGE